MLDETKKIKFDANKLGDVKIFIAHGDMDNVIDIKEAEAANKFLENPKKNVTFKTYSMPHAINGKELNDVKAWLKGNIPKEKEAVKKVEEKK